MTRYNRLFIYAISITQCIATSTHTEMIRPGDKDFLQVIKNIPDLLTYINSTLNQTIELGNQLYTAEKLMLPYINTMDDLNKQPGTPIGLGTTLTTTDLKKLEAGLQALAAGFPVMDVLINEQKGLLITLANTLDSISQYVLPAINPDISKEGQQIASQLRTISATGQPIIVNAEKLLPRIQKIVESLNKLSDSLLKLLQPKL